MSAVMQALQLLAAASGHDIADEACRMSAVVEGGVVHFNDRSQQKLASVDLRGGTLVIHREPHGFTTAEVVAVATTVECQCGACTVLHTVALGTRYTCTRCRRLVFVRTRGP